MLEKIHIYLYKYLEVIGRRHVEYMYKYKYLYWNCTCRITFIYCLRSTAPNIASNMQSACVDASLMIIDLPRDSQIRRITSTTVLVKCRCTCTINNPGYLFLRCLLS